MKIAHLSRFTINSLAISLLSFAALAATPPTAMPPPSYHGSIVVVTGGIGSDEVAAFRRVRANYALSLNYSMLNSEGHGVFVSDVQVVIRDAQDQTVLNITTDGPFCFVQLQAGDYVVHSTYLGQTQSHKIKISQTPTALDIQWKEA